MPSDRHVIGEPVKAPWNEVIRRLHGCEGGVPPLDAAHLAWWQVIARWLCTRDGGSLRKKASGIPGVPVIGKGAGVDARRAHVHAVDAWLEALRETLGLADALPAIAALPPVR